MAQQYANSIRTTLAAAITAADTALDVASAAGMPSTGDFVLRIGTELIIVGARSGVTCSSLTRGAETTTAAAHPAGAAVTLVLTAAQVRALVVGPASAVDGEIALFDATTGKLIKRATGSGIVRVVSGVFGTPGAVDLAAEVTGDLPLANLAPSAAASRLLGRGSSGAGDWEPVTLGSGLSMSGATLSATALGSGDVVGPASATDNAIVRFDGTTGKLVQNTSALTVADDGTIGFPDGVRQTFNPNGTAAGLNVGSVSGDPSSPSDGDLWYDSVAGELTARINGANVALGAGGGGVSGAGLRFASLALTNANITGMFAAPITVVAAQGANTIIVPVAAVMRIDATAGGYGGGGNIGLYLNGANPSQLTFPSVGLAGAATWNSVGIPGNASGATGATNANAVNTALTISNATASFTGGNAANSGRITVCYMVLDTTTGSVVPLSGGYGNVTSTGADGSEPSAVAGDLYLPNNGFYVKRYSGSAWVPWGPLFPMTPPVNGDFSWVNQGSASVATSNGGIHLLAPASGSASIRARVKTAPATPYTITAAFLFNLIGANYQHAGLLFRDSAGGALQTFGPQTNSNVDGLIVHSFTSPTLYSASPTNVVADALSGVVFLRIRDDGTNRIYSFSRDGQNFVTIYTVARTTFLTANQVGFFVNDQTGAYTAGATLLSWAQS